MDDEIRKIIIQLAVLGSIVFLISGPVWILAFRRYRRGLPILDYQNRRHVPWGLIDLAMVIGLVLVCGVMAGAMIARIWDVDLTVPVEKMPPDKRAIVLMASALGTLLGTAIALFAIRFRCSARWSDFGFSWNGVRRDLWIGFLAFLMIVPPVFLLQGILSQFWPYTHPLIELVQTKPDPMFFVVSGFSAVIVAPFAEELMFRGWLQGWLEKIPAFRNDPNKLFMGERADNTTPPVDGKKPLPPEDVEYSLELSKHSPDNPYAAPTSYTVKWEETIDDEHLARPVLWPILISALAFALMHYTQLPAPIPLFFLAVGLGYLYQRTHRLLPCIVVHFLLNAISMGMLLIDAYLGPKS